MQLLTKGALRRSQIVSFSILGRIERDATFRRGPSQTTARIFQYPRSDRAGCNHGEIGGLGVATAPTFSILGRIERDATIHRRC